jgi:hypothetical protein
MQRGRVRASFVLAAGLALASCGGGGGAPPPPPPPPPPAVVVANATASATSVQEGRPFSVTGSGTTTNGVPLTFAWTQVSGPAVTIANPNTATLDLSAAEVTADTTAQFRVTVTAGGLTGQATVDVTFANIAQTPVFQTLNLAASAAFNASFSNAVETILGDWSFGLVGTSTTAGGPISFTEFAQTGTQVIVSPVAPFAQTFTPPATFTFAPTPLGTTFDPAAPFVAVTEETANRYRLFRRLPSGGFSTVFMDRAITRPCTADYWFNPPASLQSRVIIGQRTQGFSIITMDAGGALYQAVNTGQSLCALALARSPINSSSTLFIGAVPPIEDIIAIDTVNNTVHRFGSDPSDPTHYIQKAQAAIQLNSATPLNFVVAKPYGNGGLALVYSDGQHNGQHRLVVVGLSTIDRSIVQVTRSWTLGVPSDVIQDDLDADGFPEVVVISSTSPQAIVFETSGPGGVPILSSLALTPSYLEIGLGATKALPKQANVLGTGGLYVAYRDRNLVRLYVP